MTQRDGSDSATEVMEAVRDSLTRANYALADVAERLGPQTFMHGRILRLSEEIVLIQMAFARVDDDLRHFLR